MANKAELAPADAPAIGDAPVINFELGRSAPIGAGSSEERSAFDRVARELRADLYRFAFWLSRDAAVAEDVVQEALLRGWRAFSGLKERGSAKQWLLTIVRREHARVHERKSVEVAELDGLGEAEHQLIAAADDPDLQVVREAIFRLNDEYREPLVLQVLFGYTTAEIAEIMEIEQGNVLTRLFRARRKLKAELGIDDGE
ncbi:MAG TPA: sigma-70 family RNA polymerase sigma factor [Gammaproteobacteria bacterium]|nr:sigma-70 family RNA polymerase sigma factor [Gammaproteobacteria bacterium]